MKRFDVNVISIIIGALFLMVALVWVDAFEVIVKYVYFCDEKNYIHQKHIYQKNITSAVFITIICLGLISIIYILFKDYAGTDTKLMEIH